MDNSPTTKVAINQASRSQMYFEDMKKIFVSVILDQLKSCFTSPPDQSEKNV